MKHHHPQHTPGTPALRDLPRMLGAAGVLVLALAPVAQVGAASSIARAHATVVEAVNVSALLGAGVSIAEVLAALQGPAGPQTGSVLIRLTQLAPASLPALPSAAQNPDSAGIAAAMTGALPGAGGTLQRELVAAVSAIKGELGADGPGDERVSITVAFN